MVETYTTARSVLRELREFMKVIIPAAPTSSPNSILNGLTTPPVFSKQERGLRDNWIKYLLWEQKNPLLLELNSEIGKKEYINRMKVVYRRAVVRMRFYSEIWHVVSAFDLCAY
jgi:cleavage stimulation factor subunit 3